MTHQVSPNQKQILRSALGLKHQESTVGDVCRNHYVLYEGSIGFTECSSLVELGLMEIGQDKMGSIPMGTHGGPLRFMPLRQVCFHVTEAGLNHV